MWIRPGARDETAKSTHIPGSFRSPPRKSRGLAKDCGARTATPLLVSRRLRKACASSKGLSSPQRHPCLGVHE
eukprot:9563866-Alexandrium_andersonii.AAC.1